MQAPEWGIIPGRAGWYWVKGWQEPKRPVKVFTSKAGFLCFISADGPIAQENFNRFEWAGPIPEPK